MKYDKSKETIEMLEEMKRQYEADAHLCRGVGCEGCPFENDCISTEEHREQRYQKVLERLAILTANDWQPLDLDNLPSCIDTNRAPNDQVGVEIERRNPSNNMWHKTTTRHWDLVRGNLNLGEEYRYRQTGTKRREFRVGDRVWGLDEGWGEVISVTNDDGNFPVIVEDENGQRETFTLEGKRYAGSRSVHQSLFFQQIPIPESALYTIDHQEELTIEQIEEKLGMKKGSLRVKGKP